MTSPGTTARRATAIVRRLDQIEPEDVKWLVPGMVPFGKLTLLEGNPGVGKSTLLADFAARVTRGLDMSGLELFKPGAVVLLSREDGLADTVRPRLDAAGADCSRIFVVDGYLGEDGGIQELSFGDPRGLAGLEALEDLINEKEAHLLCIDVLMNHVSGAKDAYSDHQMRRALQPLVDIGQRTGCAMIAVRHLRKEQSGTALTAGGGSIGIAGVARSVLLVEIDPDDANQRIVAVVKNNLAARSASLTFTIESTPNRVSRVKWLGRSDHTADSLTQARHAESNGTEQRSKATECSECLMEWLKSGPVPRIEVLRLGKLQGFSPSTVERSARVLGVRFDSTGFGKDKQSMWSLSPFPSQDPNPVTTSPPDGVMEMDGSDGNAAEMDDEETAIEREAIEHENDPEWCSGE